MVAGKRSLFIAFIALRKRPLMTIILQISCVRGLIPFLGKLTVMDVKFQRRQCVLSVQFLKDEDLFYDF